MACVFDPLLPVCILLATHYVRPHCFCCLLFIYLFLELIDYFHYYLLLRVYWLEVEVLGPSDLNLSSIIHFCEVEHPLSFLSEAQVHN